MTWVIVVLALIGVVGPLLWLLPSKRERQVGALRTAARGAGLVVELASVPKQGAKAHERVSAGGVPKEAKILCAAYRLPLPERSPAAPRWFLLKAPGGSDHSAGAAEALVAGWALRASASNAPKSPEYWRRVAALVNELPAGCVAVEADDAQVAWYGRERVGDLEVDAVAAAIHRGLAALAALQREYAKRASAAKKTPP